VPEKVNSLKSPRRMSLADLEDMLLLALSSSMPNFMGSTPAILASFSTAALSRGVHVGDLKRQNRQILTLRYPSQTIEIYQSLREGHR